VYTHEVFNQSAQLADFSLFNSDPALRRALSSAGEQRGAKYGVATMDAASAFSVLGDFGARSGAARLMEVADAAERIVPVLKQFDKNGRRQDVVQYTPDYHELMRHSIEGGCTNYGYNQQAAGVEGGDPLAHMTRAGLIYMANQLEPGHCCPVVMTAAAIPVLRGLEGYEDWTQALLQPSYDGSNAPIAHKSGVTMGMSMTEKQGGSDVRANTTRATPVDSRDTGNGARYELWGHKWFTSAPMCDGFLTLAATDPAKPPSCFLVPRWLPGDSGERNVGFQVMQLKNKLADRSNASSEVEYRGAVGTMVGEEGRGVKHIIEMVSSTRLDCALGSAGTNRRALQQALHHVSQRQAFGYALIDQPLMRSLLTDIAVECEGHTAAAFRMAELWDSRQRQLAAGDLADDPRGAAALRVGVAVAKYYVTKRSPGLAYECMEAFGGNGFVEEFPMAKLFRQSPLNSIWEGSGNVICLDILRAAESLPLFLADVRGQAATHGAVDSRLAAHLDRLDADVAAVRAAPTSRASQARARCLADALGIALVASCLVRNESPVADAYISSRVGPGAGVGVGYNYGSVEYSDALCDAVLAENMPR
jgi:putative acyl-CoA dehydrogenase